MKILLRQHGRSYEAVGSTFGTLFFRHIAGGIIRFDTWFFVPQLES